MKYYMYGLSLIACIAAQQLYSLDIETGKEFPEGDEVQVAAEAEKKAAQAAEATSTAQASTLEKEATELAGKAISIAKHHTNFALTEKQRGKLEQAKVIINKANEGRAKANKVLDMITKKINSL